MSTHCSNKTACSVSCKLHTQAAHSSCLMHLLYNLCSQLYMCANKQPTCLYKTLNCLNAHFQAAVLSAKFSAPCAKRFQAVLHRIPRVKAALIQSALAPLPPPPLPHLPKFNLPSPLPQTPSCIHLQSFAQCIPVRAARSPEYGLGTRLSFSNSHFSAQ